MTIDEILDNWCSEWRTLDRERLREDLMALVRERDAEIAELREALAAIASTKDDNFWKMREWCDAHDLYIDDLSDERAWVAVAEKALGGKR